MGLHFCILLASAKMRGDIEGIQVFKDLQRGPIWHKSCLIKAMVAYELYLYDEMKGYKLIGILPERRKDPKRITKESVLRWGRMLLGDGINDKNIFFEQVEIDQMAGKIF